MKIARHKGPATAPRLDLHPCAGVPVTLILRAGVPLGQAIAEAMAQAGHDSAWIEFTDAPVEVLRYVLPSDQPTEHTIVWYSEQHTLPMPGRITRIGLTVGTFEGASFLHGHGLWQGTDGQTRMGHILPDETVLSVDAVARGVATPGARFDRTPDPETGFALFQPVSDAGPASATTALLRIRPNTEITQAFAQACATLGWARAQVQGLGSIIGATFGDGRALPSFATEFLILEAETTPVAGEAPPPEIAIVGVDGGNVMTGRLQQGANPVLVTAEIFLSKLA